jgi:hypothetical protein
MFCKGENMDWYLTGLDDKARVEAMCLFAGAVRIGVFNGGVGVKETNVSDHLRGVAELFTRNHLRDPRGGGNFNEGVKGSGYMSRNLENLLAGYKKADAAPVHKTPIPLEVITEIATSRTCLGQKCDSRIRDLVEVGYLHLLRPGEYCRMEKKKGKTKTPKSSVLRLRNIKFFTDEGILFEGAKVVRGDFVEDSDLKSRAVQRLLKLATHVEITHDVQKNGDKGQKVASRRAVVGNVLCPVESVGRIVVDMISQGLGGDEAINCLRVSGSDYRLQYIGPEPILKTIRDTARTLGAEKLGVHADDLQLHGLRAGGAYLLMKLGMTSIEIQIRGRWKSSAYLDYLSASLRDQQDSVYNGIRGLE